MKLDTFISNVLQDIDNGLRAAQEKTNKRYSVGVIESDGVDFDIAVTTTSTTDTQIEGKAKVGFVQVLGADVAAKLGNKDENSHVSRIQFSVFVPERTSS
ncbi:MAG: hypothetical protein ACJ8AI_16090 [Rhodopila sp.]|jgi:hypothetical protein